jgi:hypothetical protein
MENFDVEFEDEVEQEEFSNLCDFLFPFLMFLWLHFDVPCNIDKNLMFLKIFCSYFNFDVDY